MWLARRLGGGLLSAVGLIWFLQGIGVAKGSPMTGQSEWMLAGAAVALVGIALVVWPRRRARQDS